MWGVDATSDNKEKNKNSYIKYLETGISLGRVSSDLDLVLNKSDVEKVIAICDKLGYEYHDYRQNPLSIEGYMPHYCMINNEY